MLSKIHSYRLLFGDFAYWVVPVAQVFTLVKVFKNVYVVKW